MDGAGERTAAAPARPPALADAAVRRMARLGAALLLLLGGAALLAAWQLRALAREQARATLQAQATALAAHAGEVLSAADFVLGGIAERAAGAVDDAGLRRRFGQRDGHEWLRLREQSFHPVSMVSVFDSRGQLVGISRQFPAPAIGIADREAFRVPASGVATMHVTAPARNRFDGRWSFFASRRLQAPDGRFLGAAHIGMDCEEFARFYTAAARTPEAPEGGREAMLVRSAYATVLARAPSDEAWLGRTLPAPAADWLVERAPVPGQPLFVQVQASEAAALASWRRQARVSGALLATTLLLLAAGCGALVAALERRESELRLTQRLRLAAEAASHAKTEFLGTLHHEVRTPLNGILGCAEMLRQADLPPPAQAQVHTLQRSALRLQGLLDDLLDYARLEAGELQLQRQAFDPVAQLQALAAAFAGAAQAKGLALRAEPAADVPRAVLGDADRIRQAVSQLVDNAVKFTRRGGVTLALAPEPSGGGLRWQVHDTGPGVPQGLRERLFEVFVQADASARRHAEGTGLGLALAQRLARLMGGSIGLDTRPGAGSTFWISLPLEEAAPAQAPPAPAAPARPPRVLVVEDDAVNAMVADAQLAQLGCTAVVAPDGESALRLLGSERFDLVLMDCMLPGLSGYEVTECHRAAERSRGGRRLPIVALSANTLHSNAERCRAAGMDDFIAKPATMAQLQQALGRWLAT